MTAEEVVTVTPIAGVARVSKAQRARARTAVLSTLPLLWVLTLTQQLP